MKTLKEQLEEKNTEIEALSKLAEKLTDEEVEKLDVFNHQAMRIKAQIQSEDLIAEQKETEKKAAEADKKEAVEAAVKAERDRHTAESRRLPSYEGAPGQTRFAFTREYDGLDNTELSMVIDVLKGANKPVKPAAIKAMAIRLAEMKDDNTLEGRRSLAYVRQAFKAETGIDPEMAAVESAIKTSGDPNYTGGSLVGSDWVGTAYSTELWRVIRANCLVAAKIPEDVIPDGYSNKYWPLESTDPAWYKISEASAGDATLNVPSATVTSSKLATAAKQITVGKVGARVVYTGEMTEDSLIQFVPQLREQLQISGTELLEHMIIDGDVEVSASKNINAIEGSPAGTEPYLVADGFRKLALVTNTANSRSAGGSLDISDYKNTLKLMGTAGIAGADLTKVLFIVDANVHFANMDLPEVKTKDVNTAATVENGFLKVAYGVPIIPSWQMQRGKIGTNLKRMTNSAGKIDATTDGNNLYGAILAVRPDQWKQAFKRRMTMETTRIANADAWEIVALMRWGMAYRDTEASAITYYVGV